MNFTDQQIYRYSRHIILPEVGGKGQGRLLGSRALLVGLGAAGSAAALYLTSAGVGRIAVADDSTVSLPDLQSQILYSTREIASGKTQCARRKLLELNPDVQIEALPTSAITDGARNLSQRYDVVLDASEDVSLHYALNEACVAALLPLVIADMDGFRAYVQTILPGRGPCYRCLRPEPGNVANKAVLSPLAGVVGSLVATEAIKVLLGKGQPLSDRVLDIDLRAVKFTTIPASRRPDCPVCGQIQPEG